MNQKKRKRQRFPSIISFILVLSLVVSVSPMKTLALEVGIETSNEKVKKDISVLMEENITYPITGTCGNNLTWELLEDGILTINGTGEMDSSNPWKSYSQYITQIVIGDEVTSISSYAFSDCKGIINVIMPKGLESIEDYAFYGCTGINSFTMPASVSIASNSDAFTGCTGVEKVKLIGSDEMSENLSGTRTPWYQGSLGGQIVTVEIEEGITSISDYAFYGCTNLTSVTIPDSITNIGEGAFQRCTNLTGNIIIPEKITSIKSNTFSGCSSLTGEIQLPSNVTQIGSYAFYGCTGITDVIMPESLESIEDYAFYNCTGIKSFTMPASVSITSNSDAFTGCKGIEKVKLIGMGEMSENLSRNRTPWYQSSLHGQIVTVEIEEGITSISDYAFSGCTNLVSVTIPNSITNIGEGAFQSCTNLTGNIIIPEESTSIGNYTFNGCSSLTGEVKIPSKVTQIGSYAFDGCTGITDVVMPEGLERIEDYAFRNCTGIKSFTMPASVSIDSNSDAFTGCKGVEKVKLIGMGEMSENLSTFYTPWYQGSLGEHNVTVEMEEGITSISAYAFSGCTNLASVTLPNSITNIGENAFNSVSNNFLLYCYLDSYAQTYAKNNNIKYELLFIGQTLTVSVVDENNNPLTTGFSVTWYDEDGNRLGVGTTLSGVDENKNYIYEISLNENLASSYYQPKSCTVSGKNGLAVYKLEKVPTITVSGKVTDYDENPQEGAELIFTQTVNGQYKVDTTTVSDSEGNYYIEILNVPTQVTYSLKEYYSGSITAIQSQHNDSHLDLETIRLIKLPADRINLSIKMINAVKLQETAEITNIYNTANLSFSLYNNTQKYEMEEFVVEYPYIVLTDASIKPEDEIIVKVIDNKNEMTSVPVSVKLDEMRTGAIEICFIQNGYFSIESISGNKENKIMVFDADGNFVKDYLCAASCESQTLPAGSYTLVFMQKTSLLNKVANISKLTDLGLKANIDYIIKNITISNGTISTISNIVVPTLEEQHLYYTVSEHTSLQTNNNSLITGRYFLLRAEYEINRKYNTSDQYITVELPESVEIVQGSIVLNGKAVPVSQDGRTVKIVADCQKAVINLYAIANKAGKYNINAYLAFSYNGDFIQQPIGTVNIEAAAAKITIPSSTNQKTITASGLALPKSSVKVYDNNNYVGTTTANANGTWKLTFDLVENYSFTHHTVYAEVITPNISGSMITDTAEVIYYKDSVQISKVTMINTADNGQQVCEFDFLNPSDKRLHYRYWPAYPTFTFYVEFTNNNNNAHDVYVVTTNSAGEETYVPVKYDDILKCWIGTYDYKSSRDIPVSISASYSTDIDPYGIWEECQILSNSNNIELFAVDDKTLGYKLNYNGDIYEYHLIPEFFQTEEEKKAYIEEHFEEKVFETNDSAIYLGDEESCYASKNADKLFLIRIKPFLEEVSENSDIAVYSSCGCIEAGAKIGKTPGIMEYNMVKRLENCNCVDEGLRYAYANKIRSLGGIIKVAIVAPLANETISNFSSPAASGQIHNLAVKIGADLGEPAKLPWKDFPSSDEIISSLATAQQGWIKSAEEMMKMAGCWCSNETPSQPQTESAQKTTSQKVNHTLDPSGYVYEVVPSNRLEGVTATVYYSNSNIGTDAVIWDAEEYDQSNPLYTDANGQYEWFVPDGWWQVKFEKEEYATKYSEWLPVPPPQVDINIGMISNAAPVVNRIAAYTNQIEVTFSQYMDIESVKNAILLTRNANAVDNITITALNAEYNLEKTAEYATQFAIVPADKDLSGELQLSIAVTAKNYAATPMKSIYISEILTTSEHPASIAILSDNSAVLHESSNMTIALQPEITGINLEIENLTPSLVTIKTANVTTSENGTAVISLEGNLPGNALIRVTEPISGLTETFSIIVTESQPITDITLNQSELTLVIGNNVTLTASILPEDATNKTVTWDSRDNSVAIVENGKVTAIKEGTTTITATSSNGKTATCKVTVTKPQELPKKKFADVSETSWQYNPVLYVYEKGVMTGKGVDKNGDIIFAPNDMLTREQFAQILYSAEGKPNVTYSSRFKDVKENQWYTNAVIWAANQGIVSGYGNGNFGVGDNITREQLALMLYKYAQMKGYNITDRASLDKFTDASAISDWAREQLQWAVANGIMSGKGETLDPIGNATRAECAAMVRAFIRNYQDNI